MILTLGELDVYYEYFAGKENAPIFIIMHGWGGSSQSWLNVARLLNNKGYTVYLPDLPGFGQTPLDKVYTVDAYADWLDDFIRALDIQNYCLLCHSNGGRFGMPFVVKYGENVDKLFLVNSAGIVHPPTIKQRLFGIMAKIGKLFLKLPGMQTVRKYFYKLIGGHDYLALESEIKKQTFLHMIQTDVQEDAAKIDLPTHLIRGEKDTYTPLAYGHRLHELIAGSTLDVCEDEKHGIHLHDPELLVDLVMKYM